MEKIAVDFKDKGVVFYNLYTREPHPGQDTRSERNNNDPRYDFTNIPQTKTMEEREAYALKMIQDFSQNRPIIIDNFSEDRVQKWLGGGAPNSLAVIDRDGKIVLWQQWSNAKELREKLEEMTGVEDKK
ncbi:hypothetical protein ACFL6G_08035 [candidate division KSB1 bacterium]